MWGPAAVCERFLARDITFQNTAGPSKHQVVALRVVFRQVPHRRNRSSSETPPSFSKTATSMLADQTPARKNMVMAQGRTDPNQNTGIIIQRCRIGATSDLQPKGGPSGEWTGTFALNTLTYREYANKGAGAGTARRVRWRGFKVITYASEAQRYTAGQFIGGGGWLGSTGSLSPSVFEMLLL
ncbi:hypothetical protein F2Q69_00038420 [Brassica cretica]|uniref:Pectinesterase catalytic domain-containing protein n=1 Tax=Brassica cretica TaxID=69181 RepID=A0A8S9SHG8_BRACR|nr:hypothetical protein F2Q69_00038420 [Brassica cretica]